MTRPRLLPDNFTLLLVATVAAASLFPCRGDVARGFGVATNIAIGLLFFMHGVQLSREAIVAGATHWRLHLLVFAATFVMFPLLGIALRPTVTIDRVYAPVKTKQTQILDGSAKEAAAKLVEKLKFEVRVL